MGEPHSIRRGTLRSFLGRGRPERGDYIFSGPIDFQKRSNNMLCDPIDLHNQPSPQGCLQAILVLSWVALEHKNIVNIIDITPLQML